MAPLSNNNHVELEPESLAYINGWTKLLYGQTRSWQAPSDRNVSTVNWNTGSLVSFTPSSPSWRWKSRRAQSESGGTLDWTATRIRQSLDAAGTLSLWTSRTSAGTGLLLQNAIRRITVRENATTCTCRNIPTPIWWTRPIREAPPGPAAPPPRCLPSTCFTSTAKSRSSTARSPQW